MKKMLRLIFILISVFPLLSYSQNCNGNDTLEIKLFLSNVIPVMIYGKNVLIKTIGKPDKVYKSKHKFIFFKHSIDNNIKIDSIVFFKIYWYKKLAATYEVNKEYARLQSINFRDTKCSIVHKNLILNAETNFEDIKNKFPCSVDSVEFNLSPLSLTSQEEAEKQMIKMICLNTGEMKDYFIRLYFYHEKLNYLEIDYF